MNIEKVRFSRITNFTGRNGMMKCGGIEIMPVSSNNILLTALTSKGEAGKCDIFVPIEDIPQLIITLGKYVYEPEVH